MMVNGASHQFVRKSFGVFHADFYAFPRSSVFIATLVLLLTACGTKAPNAPDGASQARDSERPPIALEVIRQDVEQHESFQQVRKAACPRRIPDRIEQFRPWPAINVLQGLKYATISDDSSRGTYEKVIELTDMGRQELANELETTEDKYFITIARREYVPGLERFEKAPGRDDRLVVSFQWRWKPLNPLGERLDLRAPYSDRKEHGGRATYERNADEWKFAELWVDSDSKDYVRGVYR